MKSKFFLPFIIVTILVAFFWYYYSQSTDTTRTVKLPPPAYKPLASSSSLAVSATNTTLAGYTTFVPPGADFGPADYRSPGDKFLVPIYLGDSSFRVTIADSEAEWVKGLSGSPQLPFGEGKLFIFTKADKHGIWMKDMNFALDIIWLSAAGKIIHIAPNIAPESFPQVFRPPEAARFVLEVPSGTVANAGLSLGNQLVIDSQYLPADLH